MVCIWLSTLPSAVNHDSPLWENEGQPLTKTKTTIATSSPTTATTSAPRINSARRSESRGTSSAARYSSSMPRRYPSVAIYRLLLLAGLVERRNPARLSDDLACDRARPDPIGETLQRRRRAVRRQHQEDESRQRIAELLDVLRGARNAVQAQRLDRPVLPGEAEVADPVGVAGDRVLDQTVTRQGGDVRGRGLVVQHTLEEEVERSSVGVTSIWMDRGVLVRALHLGPVGRNRVVGVGDLWNRHVAHRVAPVDVDAQTVEVELDVGRARIARKRRTRLSRELAAALLDIAHAGVAAVCRVQEAHPPVRDLLVLREQRCQHRLRGDGSRSDELGRARRGRGRERHEGTHRNRQGLLSHQL